MDRSARRNQMRAGLSMCGGTARLLAVLGLAAGTYLLAIRPRLLRWGATREEVQARYPGAELIAGGTRSATMAVTIDAPPSRVWPWLAQMGYGRAGWYSWDHLDNLGRASEWQLHPEWQNIQVGDFLAPETGPVARSWAVAALEPERFLGLRATYELPRMRWFDPAGRWPRFYTDSLWGFQLQEKPGGRTRLIVSGYWHLRPRWLQPLLSLLVLEPSHWIMQTRQFTNLKRRAEHALPTASAVEVPASAGSTSGTR